MSLADSTSSWIRFWGAGHEVEGKKALNILPLNQQKNTTGSNDRDWAHIASWAFGVLFLLGGLGKLTSGNVEGATTGVLGIVLACFLLPPARNFAYEKTGRTLSKANRTIAIIVLLVLFSAAMPDRDIANNLETPNTQSSKDQKSTQQTETDQQAGNTDSSDVKLEKLAKKCPDPENWRQESKSFNKRDNSFKNMIAHKMSLDTPEHRVNNYLEGLSGKHVVWSGHVKNISEKLMGGYEVKVMLAYMLALGDVRLNVSKKEAKRTDSGQAICYVGRIADASRSGSVNRKEMPVYNVTLEDARIIHRYD